jgi:aerobic-type carbon monoxide dehydrogenase small subunit (CoxS/CutS family)
MPVSRNRGGRQVVAFRLNGKKVTVEAGGDVPLLYTLANDLEIAGPKFGCGRSQCGACTVLIDGYPVRSCQTPTSAAAGRSVTTLAGLCENGKPSKLQQAFIDEQAAQCGYCASGMIMTAKALLDRNPHPTDTEIRTALDGNLCRCGSHNRIVRAVLRASRKA